MDIELPTDQFLIGHGASRFKAADKVADIKRKKQIGRQLFVSQCVLLTVSDLCS